MDEKVFHRALEIDVLARTVWGEAGAAGSAAMLAVAHVVLNRVRAAQKFGQGWWGRTVIQVCQKPYQFRCWDAGGPLHREILRADAANRYFAAASRAAARVLVFAENDDPTGGATHYHRTDDVPEWAATRTPTAVVNGVAFYRFLDL